VTVILAGGPQQQGGENKTVRPSEATQMDESLQNTVKLVMQRTRASESETEPISNCFR